MLKILYILDRFPVIMESYVATELDVVTPDHDIKIAVFNEIPEQSYPTRHRFDMVRDEDHLDELVRAFKPDILHGHFFEQIERIDGISKKYGIPYTLRSHAYDIAAQRFVRQFESWADLINDDRCLGVLVFPYGRARLEQAGFRPDKLIDAGPVFNFERFINPAPRAVSNAILAVGSAWPKKNFEALIDVAPRLPGVSVDLYAAGGRLDDLKQYNASRGAPVVIKPAVQNHEMPAVFRSYDWYIYTGDNDEAGLPVSVAEAWASGIGVMLQRSRDEDYEFVGKAGYVFRELDEVVDIVSRPYPEEMRQAGFEQARYWDFRRRRGELEDVWHAYAASIGCPVKQTVLPVVTERTPGVPTFKHLWNVVRGRLGVGAPRDVAAFVILLKRDNVRCSHVYEELLPSLYKFMPIQYKCEVMDATDAKTDDLDSFMAPGRMIKSIDSYDKVSPAKLACTISHMRVWKTIVASNLKHAIVLEDDVVAEDGFGVFLNDLTKCLPPTFDLVHLYIHPEFQSDWSNLAASAPQAFVDFVPRYGRSAYLLSQSGAQKLLRQFRHLSNHGDVQIAEMANRGDLSVYCASEMHVQNIGQIYQTFNDEKLRSTIHS